MLYDAAPGDAPLARAAVSTDQTRGDGSLPALDGAFPGGHPSDRVAALSCGATPVIKQQARAARRSRRGRAQDAQLQQDALTEARCGRVYTEKISNRKATTERPGLTAALDYLRPGDTLVVWKLDRLGRSVKDVLTIADIC